jgi:hypothetical protein
MPNKSCSYMCAVAMASLCLTTVSGQQRDSQSADTPDPWTAHVTAVATISAQPGTGSSRPYLDRGLGATRPGLTIGVGVESSKSPLIMSFELSTTTPMETVQEGRFISGSLPGSAIARHRDTLLSILPGLRWRAGGAAMEVKGGVSLMFGEPTRDGEPVEEDFSAGDFALTAGFDAVFPLNPRLSLVPSFRYSVADRSDENYYVGLGTHITRAGVGLRVKL